MRLKNLFEGTTEGNGDVLAWPLFFPSLIIVLSVTQLRPEMPNDGEKCPAATTFRTEKSFRTLLCFPWPRLCISREYFEYYQTKVDGGRKSRCYPHGFLWDGPLLTFCPVVITEYGRKGKEGVCVSVRLVFVRWPEYLSFLIRTGKR